MDYKDLKMKLLENNLKFIDLVRHDGRSYQYLWREANLGNQKVLNHLSQLIEKLIKI
ncbi:hypothetical protein M2102_003356 [Fusobacterium sp. PH5-7]|uniref:hypothetical protein n=1 Tax=Fusobacterium sp. PH5-7 TaxID=2940528 RepID=UPI00247569EF|nr:hypothetical protein [Fusobacterium sp. PH5-7]MDH6459694.1 hypothetical protein [Fusobacterium sp. PH5-7]